MTEVYFAYDTEDFTSDHASDAILRQGQILRAHGVKGNFNIVGYLARELVRNRRLDVLDELKNHTVSFHSLRHTYHPTIMEYTDRAEFSAAHEELVRQEQEGMGMVKAATGVDSFPAAVPPGNSLSYVAMYHYAEMGIPLYLGSFFGTDDGHGVYFCNAMHVDYHHCMEGVFLENGGYDRDAFLEKLAPYRRVVLYNHPNKVLYREFWDIVNYRKQNLAPMHAWKEAARRPAEEAETYYTRLDELLTALQADPRFTFGDMAALGEMAELKSRERQVKKSDLPAIRAALEKDFTWLNGPVSLSVGDVFHAARHFLFSDQPYHPGKVYGFLYDPQGVTQPVTLSANEVRELACAVRAETFLPAYFVCGDKRIGPADLLFAMLDVAMGAEAVTLQPRAQQCDYARLPRLAEQAYRGTWMHDDTLADNVLSDRLRLQAWTLREE